jgi:hypothetical protein
MPSTALRTHGGVECRCQTIPLSKIVWPVHDLQAVGGTTISNALHRYTLAQFVALFVKFDSSLGLGKTFVTNLFEPVSVKGKRAYAHSTLGKWRSLTVF